MQAYYSTDFNAWYFGPPLEEAKQVWVCIHGRSASADSILPLGQALSQSGDALVAPEATRGSWYPNSFMAQRAANEPHLSRALETLQTLQNKLEQEGIPAHKQYWTGFSQGACLMLEHIYTQSPRVGGVAAFSSGLIGPMGQTWPAPTPSVLKDVPVFLSCSEKDPHIPEARFQETVTLFEQANANLQAELLPNHGHTITVDQIKRAKALLN